LIGGAVEQSAWHRARLSGLDPGAVTEDTLAGMPTMTKDDLLRLTENFWIGLHGLLTLLRGGRLRRADHERRLALLIARFSA
jgi:hypothetical protein